MTFQANGEWGFYTADDRAYLTDMVTRLAKSMSNAVESPLKVDEAAVQIFFSTNLNPCSSVLPIMGNQNGFLLTATALVSAAVNLRMLGLLSEAEMNAVQVVAEIARARMLRMTPLPDGSWSKLPVPIRPSEN